MDFFANRTSLFQRAIGSIRTEGPHKVVRRALTYARGRYALMRLPRHVAAMVPPKSLQYLGVGDFVAEGFLTCRCLVEVAGLQPDDDVLDVGCGIGRIAVPLTQVLSPDGSYSGFDTVRRGIEWCSERITPAYPNFQFRHVDLRHDYYNPDGALDPRTYAFPCADASFDLIVLASVLTHMRPAEAEHCFAEVRRVLRPDGRCAVATMVLSRATESGLAAGLAVYTLEPEPDEDGVHRLAPFQIRAYQEDALAAMVERQGLKLVSLHYGSWSGHKPSTDYQDLFILKPKPEPTVS